MRGIWLLRFALALSAAAALCFVALEVTARGTYGGGLAPLSMFQMFLLSPAVALLCISGAVAPARLRGRILIASLLLSAMLDAFWLLIYAHLPAQLQPNLFLRYLRGVIPLYLISSGIVWLLLRVDAAAGTMPARSKKAITGLANERVVAPVTLVWVLAWAWWLYSRLWPSPFPPGHSAIHEAVGMTCGTFATAFAFRDTTLSSRSARLVALGCAAGVLYSWLGVTGAYTQFAWSWSWLDVGAVAPAVLATVPAAVLVRRAFVKSG